MKVISVQEFERDFDAILDSVCDTETHVNIIDADKGINLVLLPASEYYELRAAVEAAGGKS